LAAFVVLTALAAAVLGVVISPSSVSVNVRWAPALTDGERNALERRFQLTEGRFVEGTTWQYVLTDYSSDNIRALVEHPAVEDTHRIDRTRYQPSGPPSNKIWTVTRGALAIGFAGTLLLLLVTPRGDTVRIDIAFLVILSAALLLRVYLATSETYNFDELRTSLPLAQNIISFAPGNLHLPLRGPNHGALPAYFVKVSGMLFEDTPVGYRLVHVLLSICTIVLIFFLTKEWYGSVAARWAAAFWAFNEYHLGVAAHATAHVPHLLFAVAAVFAFSRFLKLQRPGYLYAAGGFVGLAFYCKEHSALLLPVFFLALLQGSHRQWLRRPHVYLAAAMFFLVISPDLFWNLTVDPHTAVVTYGEKPVSQATYASHLRRVGGISFSPYPTMFYGRSAVMALYRRIAGRELTDDAPEYRSMNPALGVLLLGAVLITTFQRPRGDPFRGFLLLLFWSIFGFFTVIKPGPGVRPLDPVSWIWVEVTMIPAVIFAGARLADVQGKFRIPAWGFSVCALMYAVASML
jgi:Dolichyl-phosphate-mannose-protein mannosyltransferase